MTERTPQEQAELEETERIIRLLGPAVPGTFPYHPQQDRALNAATDNVIVSGGNQSGKTTVGVGIVGRLMRREGPIYRRLLNPDTRPLLIWVSPNLHEKYKSNWEDRILHEVFAGMERGVDFDYVETPRPTFTWKDACGGGKIVGKSQEQGFMAFESDIVDLIVFDEEPLDRRLYTSSQARVSGTNGVIVLLYTPLNGITWTYGSFYLPTTQPEFETGEDRCWVDAPRVTVVEMGMADNPRSVAGGGVERMRNDPSISESERQTRLFGKYGFTEGLIFPMFADLQVSNARSPYIIPELPKDRPFSWFFLADPNKRHGGLLCAVDHEGNRYYCFEHYAESIPDRLHAKAYREGLMEFAKKIAPGRKIEDSSQLIPLVDFWADPGGAGAQAIINLAEVGVFAKPVPKDAGSVKASIELIRRAAALTPGHKNPYTGQSPAPYVYFLSTLKTRWRWEGVTFHESRLMWELRQYRQKEDAPPDTPIKEKDDLADCARYLELVRPFTPAPEDMSVREERAKLDGLSQRAAEEYDQVINQGRKAKSPFEPL